MPTLLLDPIKHPLHTPLKAAGVSFRQDTLEQIHYDHTTDQPTGIPIPIIVELRPDPTNPYDPKAVALYVSPHHHIGYLPRPYALLIHESLAQVNQLRETTIQCHAQLIPPQQHGHSYAVHLLMTLEGLRAACNASPVT